MVFEETYRKEILYFPKQESRVLVEAELIAHSLILLDLMFDHLLSVFFFLLGYGYVDCIVYVDCTMTVDIHD